MTFKNKYTRRLTPRKMAATAAILACAGVSAQPQVATSNEPAAPFRITGGVSYGLGVRTTQQDDSLLMSNNARSIGLVSTNGAGRNQDDGNLNYAKGDVYSNAVNAFADLNFKSGPISALVRVQGWHDFELKEGDVPFGHVPNGYVPNTPLSDREARPRGKFSNVILSTAYVQGEFHAGQVPMTATLGQQNIGWRGYGLAAGTMAAIDPVDLAARARAGAPNEMGLIPFPALRLAAKPSNDLRLDGFYQLGFEPTQLPLCGTFLTPVDVYGFDGCELQMNGGVGQTRNDRELLAFGGTVRQSPAPKPGNQGQFGVSGRWNPQEGTELGLSYARIHSRIAFFDTTKTTNPATPFVPNDPRNPFAEGVYPRGIQLFSIEGKHDLKPTVLYGSIGYSPNRPIGYPQGEVAQTFLSPVATVFRPAERALPLGGSFSAWDRRKTSDLQIGASRAFRDLLGAAVVNVQGELNARMIHDFPDQNQVRYARPDVFGLGPVNGTCLNPAVCSSEGYVTKSAWGYTLQVTANYPKLLSGVTLRPRAVLTHDVKGYSFDGLMKEGRVRLGLGLDAVYNNFALGVAFVHNVSKSDFDNQRDRNYMTVALSARF